MTTTTTTTKRTWKKQKSMACVNDFIDILKNKFKIDNYSNYNKWVNDSNLIIDMQKTFTNFDNKVNNIINDDNKNLKFLSQGNLKLHKNIAIWSIPEGMTCPCLCDSCYAFDSARQYKNTSKKRNSNLMIVEKSLHTNNTYKNNFINCIVDEIQKAHKKYGNDTILRIHESGDFYSLDYVYLWVNIANKIHKKISNNIMIYTYTKNEKYKKILMDNNINVVNSLFYYIDDDKKLKIHFNYFDFGNKDRKIFTKEYKIFLKCIEYLKNSNIEDKNMYLCNYKLKALLNSYRYYKILKLQKTHDVIINKKSC